MNIKFIEIRRTILTRVMVLVLLLAATVLPVAIAGEAVEISILTVNDFHGALLENGKTPGAAKLATFILNERAKNPQGTIILSAGDMMQGSARSNILQGKPVIEMMNVIGFQAMAVGNHEFDWGTDVLYARQKESRFPWLAANIFEKKTGKLAAFATAYKIIKVNNVNVAIIGATTPETAYTTTMSVAEKFDFQDYIASVNKLVPVVRRAGAELVIVLGHLGSSNSVTIVGEAANLAQEVSGIDAIVSGHTHERVAGKVSGTPIVQAYTRGEAVGKITLLYSKEAGKVVDATAETIAVDPKGLLPNKKVEKIIERSEKRARPIELTVLAETMRPIPHDRHTFSLLGEFLTDALRAELNSDVAFINGGGVRRSLAQGKITLGDLYDISPFDNNIYTMQMSGKVIMQVLEYGLGNKTYGWLQYSGLNIICDPTKPVGKKIISIALKDGKPVEANKMYKVVCSDFLVDGGDGYKMFKEASNVVNTNMVVRDVFAKAFREAKLLDLREDGRLKIVKSIQERQAA